MKFVCNEKYVIHFKLCFTNTFWVHSTFAVVKGPACFAVSTQETNKKILIIKKLLNN